MTDHIKATEELKQEIKAIEKRLIDHIDENTRLLASEIITANREALAEVRAISSKIDDLGKQ